MGKNEIIVSFCIPSYNRAEMTVIMVNSILEYKGDDIEVIVTEDSSTDDTVERLEKIDDPRLRVIVNQERKGGAGNMTESLRFGEGKYSFVAFSREKLKGDRIKDLVDFLKQDEFSLVYCCEDKRDHEHFFFKDGMSAAREWAYAWLHPTGLTFNTKELLQIIDNVNSEDASEKYLYFPHDFWITELCLKGKGKFARYNKIVRIRAEEKYIKNSSSANVNYKNDCWFYPKGRLNQFSKYMAHLNNLDTDNKVKTDLLYWTYLRTLALSTLSYKAMAADEKTCTHWKMQPKNVSFMEVMNAADLVKKSTKEIMSKYDYHLSGFRKLRLEFPRAETFLRYIKYKADRLVRK